MLYIFHSLKTNLNIKSQKIQQQVAAVKLKTVFLTYTLTSTSPKIL